MRSPEQTIGNIIDKASTSFIAYIDDEGFPITKAMLKPRERNGIKEIWFSTNTSSNKVKFLKVNNKASVYFVDKRFFRGVSLIGTIEMLETSEAKQQVVIGGNEGGSSHEDDTYLKFWRQLPKSNYHVRKGFWR